MSNNTEIVSQKLVSDFEQTLVADGKAPKTVESYTGDIRAFLEWLESKWGTETIRVKNHSRSKKM